MNLLKNIEINQLIDEYGNLLGEKQLSVMKDYYFENFGLSEIAQSNGISRQAVLDLLKRCEKKLYFYEEKLQLVKKKHELLNAVNKDVACIEQIKNLIEEL